MSEIKRAIQQLSKSPEDFQSIIATVLEVRPADRVIDVQPRNSKAAIYSVRLQSVVKGDTGFVAIPKVGSDVIVSFISNTLAFVALCSEYERINLVVPSMSMSTEEFVSNLGSSKIEADSVEVTSKDGFKIETESESLKNIWAELISILNAFQLLHPQGPTTGIAPQIATRLTSLETRVNTILK